MASGAVFVIGYLFHVWVVLCAPDLDFSLLSVGGVIGWFKSSI